MPPDGAWVVARAVLCSDAPVLDVEHSHLGGPIATVLLVSEVANDPNLIADLCGCGVVGCREDVFWVAIDGDRLAIDHHNVGVRIGSLHWRLSMVKPIDLQAGLMC